MARRVILLCDICDAKDIQAEGQEETITLNNLKPRILAMCDTCRKEYYEPLETVLQQLGQIASGDLMRFGGKAPTLPSSKTGTRRFKVSDEAYGPFAAGKWVCPFVDESGKCTARPLQDKASVQKHFRATHHMTLGEYLSGHAPAQDELDLTGGPTSEMPLRHIPDQGIRIFCPVPECNLHKDYQGESRHVGPAKNKRSLQTHFNQRHEIPMGEWFRQHPEVDPESLLVPE